MTHENADFDAIASLVAAKRLYPDATPLLPRRLNRNVRDFMNLYGEVFPLVYQEEAPRRRFKRVLLVDTQSLASQRGIAQRPELHIVDHHPLSHDLEPGWTYTGGETGATTTLLVEAIREKNLLLQPLEATLFTLGIYEDTGSLSYADTTPRDLNASAYLLEHGAQLNLVSEFLHHPLSEDQRKLYQQLLDAAETHIISGHSIVIASARTKRYVEEVSTLAHQLMRLYDPSALFLFVQMEDQIQLVARSRNPRAIDLSQIVRAFGGGGHASAAAALIHERGLARQKRKLLKLLGEQIRPLIRVQDIMSYGVRVLDPKTTISQAAELARRWGHEGFPVVSNKKLVGVLTRREIDRALHHKLQKQPVKQFMNEPVSVRRGDSIEQLERMMIEHGLGQVPVVEDGQILGIVTRTDLIKAHALGAEPPEQAQAEKIVARLERALPRPLLQLVQQVSEMAREQGYSTYLVGGFVRDLLIGQANLDVDIVIEGDAIHLAYKLAEKYSGRVHTHARFGTAKWILEEQNGRPSQTLDLATARTEFYEYPSALPDVERSSIKLDLHRRDFTINAMALCLDPDRYGALLDPYGGELDLQRGLIRVLHNLSFVEDPTRILRAVRFEQRFGFHIEARTAELISNALDILDRVSGERLRRELDLILSEAVPEQALARLQEFGALQRIQPSLKADDWLASKFRALRGSLAPTPLLYLGLMACRLRTSEVKHLAARLKLPKDETDMLQQVVSLRLLERQLSANDLKPSRVVELIDRFSDPALVVFAIATRSDQARAYVDEFRERWRAVQPEVTGEDLKKLGLKPGPVYREILSRLRALVLDGELTTRTEQETWVNSWLLEGDKFDER